MYGIGFGYGAIGSTTKRSSGVAIDADAQAFFTANSTLTDATTKNAINQFVLDLKSNSLWTLGKMIHLGFLGNSTKNSVNLFNPSNIFTYTSGFTFDSHGVTGNGTSSYIDTITPYTTYIADQTSVTAGIYSQTNASHPSCDFGICTNLSTGLQLFSKYSDDKTYHSNGDYLLNGASNILSDSRGNICTLRINNTTKKIYKNGVELSSYNSSINTYSNSDSMYLFNRRENGTPAAGLYSNRKITLHYLFDGLNPTQISNLNTCINTLLTTLSIPTW